MLDQGDIIPPFGITVALPAIQAWAGFLHDPNPVHLDAGYVRARGLGERVIAQGPANLACIINALGAAFPGGRIETLDIRFLDSVYEGDAVVASGRVTKVETTDRLRTFTCEVWLAAAGRDPALAGLAVVVQPNAPIPR